LLKAFVVVALIAAFVLFASMVGMIVYSSEEFSRDDQKQPAIAEHSNAENGNAPTNENAAQHATESKKKREWYRIFTDHVTDWLLVLFNGLLVAATIALFVSGERNVDVARRAANAAINQAKAAGDANVAATKALQQSQRPWVVVDSIRLIKPIFEVNGRYEIFFNLCLKNTGNSVATDVFPVMRIEENLVATLESNWNKTDDDLRQKKEFIVKPSKWPLGIVLAPGQSIPQPFGFGGPHQSPGYPSTEKVRAGTFYLLGLIEYKDQFGITHKTRFAFNPRGDSVNPWDGDTFVVSGGMQEAD
jgi:hypothetical protein